MARYSDEVIERLKSEVSLVRLLKSQGYELKKQGKDYLCRCPFHDDRTPSLVVSPDKNLWNCLGACGTGGSVIDWVMKVEGVSFRHAVELLKNDFAPLVAGSDSPKPVKESTVRKLDAPLSREADEQQALKDVIDFYHETLKQSPEVIEYLDSRGLNNNELINQFKLGYANRSLGYRLPEKNRQAGAELRGKLQNIGILRKSGHEHFNGSLVVPVFSREGLITEVYGRKIKNNLRKGTAYHLYLPGEHTGVWNEQSLRSDEIILCESLIDAMTFWCHGFRNVTTSYGVNGFTQDILNALINNGVKRVLIAYDRDDAGNKAAEKLAEQLQTHSISCYRILFPKGMDANEYALQVQPAVKSLALVIRKAEPMLSAKPRQKTTELPGEKTKVNQEEKESSSLAADLPEPEPSVEHKPAKNTEAEVTEREVKMMFGDRCYRVRGLNRNLSYDQLKVNVMVSQNDDVHVDTLELYNAKQRQTFIKIAASELNCEAQVIKKDLGKVLLKLEELQEENINKELGTGSEERKAISDEEKAKALALLKDKNLLSRILEDFNACGVVGEETNKLVGYLAGVSRKLDKPLAVIIQSSSAAGKSSLMDAVLNLMPEEERVQYSAMTGQSLYYLGETNLKNKILAIAEEEGAEHASYALKLLQSEGEINIASTGKNATTGNLETQTYHVEGPVMLFLTTTAIDIDEELLNRCLVLTVNESREQTEAIHHQQRIAETLEGMRLKQKKEHLVKLHRNAQRLLRPLAVVNPYAEHLTFLSHQTRTRRDHQKYLALIRSIAFLHQYQRDVKSDNGLEYIEVTLDDIAIANQLAHEVLGRTLDELPPQTRKLLSLVTEYVKTECEQQGIEQSDFRFSRRDIRAFTGWSDNQLKVHCRRLEDLEYLINHRGGRGQLIQYGLLFTGDLSAEKPQLMGLIDTNTINNKSPKQDYDLEKLGQSQQKMDSSCAQVGTKLDVSCDDKNNANLNGDKASKVIELEEHQNDLFTVNETAASYKHIPSLTG